MTNKGLIEKLDVIQGCKFLETVVIIVI